MKSNHKLFSPVKTVLKSSSLLVFTFILLSMSGCSKMTLRHKSPHFVFIYNNQIDFQEVQKVAAALESNYERISNDLQTKPTNPIEVSIYSNRWTYAATNGHWYSSGNIQGTGKLHFLTGGGRGEDAETIAVHEFSHAVMLKLLIDREKVPLDKANFDKKFNKFPVWLFEGIAVYEANQFVHPRSLNFLAANKYPELEELNNRSMGLKIYKVGYTMIEYILEKHGRAKLLELIASYGDVKVLNTTSKDFSRDWYAFVKKKYLRE